MGDGDEIVHTHGTAAQIWKVSNSYLTTFMSVPETRLPRLPTFSTAELVAALAPRFILLVPQIAEEWKTSLFGISDTDSETNGVTAKENTLV